MNPPKTDAVETCPQCAATYCAEACPFCERIDAVLDAPPIDDVESLQQAIARSNHENQIHTIRGP